MARFKVEQDGGDVTFTLGDGSVHTYAVTRGAITVPDEQAGAALLVPGAEPANEDTRDVLAEPAGT